MASPSRRGLFIPALLTCVLASSCGSIIERSLRHSYIYPGVQLDYNVLFHDLDWMA